ncbi:MAG: hypothetical protein LQ338_003498 [Usnochroma carphineum]|nr:MAG: hypothetical protein LQ338_003498 [Usnochroma carphineum]
MGVPSTEEHGFRQRTKVVWNAKRLRNNQDRIRGQMISMNLLISILNLPQSRHPSEDSNEYPAMLSSDASASSIVPDRAAELDSRCVVGNTALCELSGTDNPPTAAPIRQISAQQTDKDDNYTPQHLKQLFAQPDVYRKDQPVSQPRDIVLSIEELAIQSSPTRPESFDCLKAGPGGRGQHDSACTIERIVSQYLKKTDLIDNAQQSHHEQGNGTCPLPTVQTIHDHATSEGQFSNDGDLAYSTCAAKLHTASNQGETESVFLDACQHGTIRVVQELLGSGIDVHCRVKQADTSGPGPTAVHIAVMHGQSEVAIALLRHGAHPNAQDHNGRRPLHHAAENGDSSMTALLLEHGARPECCDNTGVRPLHTACQRGALGVARLLLDAGASFEAADDNSYRPLHYLAQHGNDPHSTKVFIDLGCDIDARTIKGYTALQLACMSGNDGVLDVLLNHGASPNSKEWLAGPLALAVSSGHVRAAGRLLESGAEADSACPTTHRTFLHLIAEHACCDGRPGKTFGAEMVALLCKYGAAINAQDVLGNTPLHVALSLPINGTKVNGQRFMVRCLITQGARADIANRNGEYPLTLASRNHDLPIFRLVLEASMHTLSDKHMARIHREVRKQKAPADDSKLNEMNSLLKTGLFLRAM